MSTRSRRPLVIEGGSPRISAAIKQFKPVPEDGIADAVALLRTGRTFRYGAKDPEDSHVAMFEREFSDWLGCRYTVAVNSCGSAMFLAMRILGVEAGDKVLVNAFTFAAVPSAIHHAGAQAVLVESGRDWAIDCDDLERQAASSGARVLLLSYMRGHIPQMDRVVDICKRHDIALIEDCAHAYGTTFDGVRMGRFGDIACFSTQSSKGLSVGEGGMICTDDSTSAAKAILYAGSYEQRWKRHVEVPPECAELQEQIPGYSMRMTELQGALLRPQIPRLAEIAEVHQDNHRALRRRLNAHPNVDVPQVDPRIQMFGDTLQFHLVGLGGTKADRFIELCAMENLPMQIFGRVGNARDYRNWCFLPAAPTMPLTDRSIGLACDLTLGPHLTPEDIQDIASVIEDVLDHLQGAR